MDDDQDVQQSEDDALEPQNDIFDTTRDEDVLPEDGERPAAPADDIHAGVPVDSPATDDGIDSDELYQEGLAGATNADDEAVNEDEEPQPLDGYDES